MKRNQKAKKWIISAVALVLVAAIGLGVWYFAGHSSTEPVNVYRFYEIGMTEYWGDSRESYGPVTTDRIQTVFLSDTQTVTEIFVAAGDTVKKGDLLMTFDTTLSDLALERERLEVEKLKLQLEDAYEQLREINSMRPMVIPTPPAEDPDEGDNLGAELTELFQLSLQEKYDGSTQELALVCWVRGDTPIDDDLLEVIRQTAERYQEENARKEAATEPTEPAETEPEEVPSEPVEESTEPTGATEPPAATEENPVSPAPPAESGPAGEDPSEPGEEPEDPTEPEIDLTVDRFFVIIKVTENNRALGSTKTWQGLVVTRDPEDNSFSFRFFDASYTPDHTLAQPDVPDLDTPQIDYGSGFTAAQIAQMRSEQEKTIKDLQFRIKMAEADYKIMQTEVSDGNVYAQIDGEVVSVLTEEEARASMQPVLKVSGGGGFYVEGSVSELEKDILQIGQEVTVMDWNTGMSYPATVESIGDFPAADGYWNGMGNPNASYYPFTVFVDGSADLQAGNYVSVTYAAGEAEQGIYLENPFLRTEQGKTYVYVRGESGRLEKRYVTTGKSLWGSYTQILSGLTAEDLIAFPYGKNIKEGAETVESDLSELYNY